MSSLVKVLRASRLRIVVHHEPLPQGRLLHVVWCERKQHGAKLLSQRDRGPSVVAVERGSYRRHLSIEFRPEYRPTTNFRVVSRTVRVGFVRRR
jgi:hypothetical protein